jgi:hypothetical protein
MIGIAVPRDNQGENHSATIKKAAPEKACAPTDQHDHTLATGPPLQTPIAAAILIQIVAQT